MKKRTVLLIGCLVALLPVPAHAFKLAKGQSCMDCHTLERSEAEKILEKAVPGAKILGIQASPMAGSWQINLQQGERSGAVLLDFSKKFLISQLVPIDAAVKQVRKVDVASIPLADAVLVGAADAKQKVIVFTDPDCPFCRELHKTIKQVVEKRKDIAFSLILIPGATHPDSPKKVQAILCSKSITMLDDAFNDRDVPDPECPPDALERNKALARSFAFKGTPSLVRDDGTVLSGSLPIDQLLNWIDKKS